MRLLLDVSVHVPRAGEGAGSDITALISGRMSSLWVLIG